MSVSYYDNNAQEFYNGTVNLEMQSLYNEFLPLIPPNGSILDAGCGSGRDTLAFKSQGFKVHAIDASAELAQLAETLIKQPVEVTTFQQFNSSVQFDAVWACASLLHVPFDELSLVFNNLANLLNDGGVFYCSFKYGDDEVERNGRFFTNLDEARLNIILAATSLAAQKLWKTSDLRKGREKEQWLNAILVKR
ncbi:class I SAM-dependent methyltransferase [Vibrio mediterranei]|uniref:class I SAM-dependent methyltransferase n=1 Tax=Vibrio mediterranei TaxID=689 RepID=UPI001EFDFF41|nr:class I SAM-dependent methyltransferase [Vibrio mediterranei]